MIPAGLRGQESALVRGMLAQATLSHLFILQDQHMADAPPRSRLCFELDPAELRLRGLEALRGPLSAQSNDCVPSVVRLGLPAQLKRLL